MIGCALLGASAFGLTTARRRRGASRATKDSTYWLSGGHTVYDGLRSDQAHETAYYHRQHGHTCKLEFREVTDWAEYKPRGRVS